jgi:hypothetical protein
LHLSLVSTKSRSLSQPPHSFRQPFSPIILETTIRATTAQGRPDFPSARRVTSHLAFVTMSVCCRTCDHRNSAVQATTSTPSQLQVCLITLSFKASISPHTRPYAALNTVLNNIVDSVETTSRPTTFTTWSPCLTNPHIAMIISTARETCGSATSPVFEDLLQHLTTPPTIQNIYLEYSILSLAASNPNQRIPIDVIQLQAPNPSVAAAIGKHFGWDPKRSSLSLQPSSSAFAAISRPGDLVKDFWAWAELQHEDPLSPGSSFTSSYESLPKPKVLRSWNTDEKNMSLPFPDEEDEDSRSGMDDETLIMIFQWSSHADAERFKHPSQASYGQNGETVSQDLWDRQVAHPIRQLQGVGAKMESCKLELRAVEPRLDVSIQAGEGRAGRVRSGSKRLSIMASGLSERVSGFWK